MKSITILWIVISLSRGSVSNAQSIAEVKDDSNDGQAPMPFFLTDNDGGINGINSIPTFQCSYSIMPAVVIENFGAVDMTSATLEYFIDGGTPATYEWEGILAPFYTDTFTLPVMVVSPGTHTLYINVIEANGEVDNNGGNDGSFMFNVVGSSELVPYVETFEDPALPSGFFVENSNLGPTWEPITFNDQYTTVNCVTMPLYINDVSGDIDDLFIQNVDLSNISQAQLSFNVAYAYYSEYYWDGLRVMISTDCGNVWDVVYDKDKEELATAPPTDVPFTPSAQHWRTEVEDLSIYAGFSNVMIKFETVSGHGNNLYIDNIAINDNVGITSEEHEGADLRLFPNPANEAVNVLFRSLKLIENEIRIFNCLGKQIFTTGKQVAFETNIPVKEFTPGSYTVTINSGSGQLAAAKLIIFH